MEIMTAMPVGMLASLVFTVAYLPAYDNDDSMASEVPEPVTVVVPDLYAEYFLEEASMYMGLEEYLDFAEEAPTLTQHIESHKGFCPHFVNAMYIDEMCKVKVLDIECLSQFPSMLNMQH